MRRNKNKKAMFVIPNSYHSLLPWDETETAIKFIKATFQTQLAEKLNLQRATAPLFVLSGTGINDDLNGVERPVAFDIPCMNQRAEVVHSLAKWKRAKLATHSIPAGRGIYTDMNAIRAFETLDNLHSLYVDQWDWELAIRHDERTTNFLKATVEKIFKAMKETERAVCSRFPQLPPRLPDSITFIHTEDLLQAYPTLPPKERETEAARRYGAVFLIGIGAPLSNGEPHDGRAPDYDDWTSSDDGIHRGLNGDIIVWDDILNMPLELSSMGIRVDAKSLSLQLGLQNCRERESLPFHAALLRGELPDSIGGGIGQSRLCMYLLHKAHIGEVQASIWPEEQAKECAAHGITLM